MCNIPGELTMKKSCEKTYTVNEVERLLMNAIRLISSTDTIRKSGIQIYANYSEEKRGIKIHVGKENTLQMQSAIIELE